MKITRYRFADEAPRIGCGERGVIITRGHKWTRFEECATGRRAKMTTVVFDRVKDARLIKIAVM